MGRKWTHASVRCGAFAEDDRGRRLVCTLAVGHKCERCFDQRHDEDFIPDHPRQFTIKGKPRRT